MKFFLISTILSAVVTATPSPSNSFYDPSKDVTCAHGPNGADCVSGHVGDAPLIGTLTEDVSKRDAGLHKRIVCGLPSGDTVCLASCFAEGFCDSYCDQGICKCKCKDIGNPPALCLKRDC